MTKFNLLNLVIVLFLAFPVLGNQHNANEILINSILDIENQLTNVNQKNSSYQLHGLDAWVDDSKLNWSNSDLGDFDKQKLSFEVRLKNGEQMRAEEQILNMGQSKTTLKLTNLLEKRLKNTYASLIGYIEQQRHKRILRQQRNLANLELNSWKIKVNSNAFRADKLQQADLTLDNIWAEELSNNAMLKRYDTQHINRNKGNSQYFKYTSDNLLSIREMVDITRGIIATGVYQEHNALIKRAEFDVALLSKKIQRNNAQKKLSLNSVKFEYDNKDNDLGLSVGIKMPITKNSYESLLEEQQQRYASIDAQHSVIEISELLKEKQFKIMQIQDQWLSYQKLLQKINVRIIRLSKTNDIDLLLDLKQEYLQKKMNQEETQIQALKEYISFLSTAGMLSAKPYRNWIHSGAPRIL